MSTELAPSQDRQILNSMRKMFDVIEIHTNRLDSIDGRLEQVELIMDRDIFLNTRQAATLQATARAKVRELLPDKEDYKKLSKKYFPALWNELKARFAVPSYREIPRKEFKAALLLINEWHPVRVIS